MDQKGGPRRFVTTRWSLVRAVRDRNSPGFESALATLCETYWPAIYAFVLRSGYNIDDARDLTQAFFAWVLEKDALTKARQERGRFRSFLLTLLKNFLANQYDWQHAMKRGGHSPHVSLEFESEERRYRLEPVDELTPERVYERRWARSVMDYAMQRLSTQYQDSPRRILFKRLRPLLTYDSAVPSNELALELGMSSGALRVALSRLRKQYQVALRETIAETVASDDVDDELRHLMDVISR